MIINFKEINFYYLTCNNKPRRDNMEEQFKNYKLKPVFPVMGIMKEKSGATGFLRVLDKAAQDQPYNKPFQPFVIFEDDVKISSKGIPDQITIPDDADMFYIGLSRYGIDSKQSIGFRYRSVDDNIVKIYNMLALHGVIICSLRGFSIFQKSLMNDYNLRRIWDLTICEVQNQLNVYALRNPLVYQWRPLGGNEGATGFSILPGDDDPRADKSININKIVDNIVTKTNYYEEDQIATRDKKNYIEIGSHDEDVKILDCCLPKTTKLYELKPQISYIPDMFTYEFTGEKLIITRTKGGWDKGWGHNLIGYIKMN